MTDIPEDVMKAVNEALAEPDVDEHGNCARYFIDGRYLHIVQNCIARAILAERARCANVAEKYSDGVYAAMAIRGEEPFPS